MLSHIVVETALLTWTAALWTTVGANDWGDRASNTPANSEAPFVNFQSQSMNVQQFQKASSIVVTLDGVEVGSVVSIEQESNGTGVTLRGMSVTWTSFEAWLDGKSYTGDLEILGKGPNGSILTRADLDLMRVVRHSTPTTSRQKTVVSEIVVALK